MVEFVTLSVQTVKREEIRMHWALVGTLDHAFIFTYDGAVECCQTMGLDRDRCIVLLSNVDNECVVQLPSRWYVCKVWFPPATLTVQTIERIDSMLSVFVVTWKAHLETTKSTKRHFDSIREALTFADDQLARGYWVTLQGWTPDRSAYFVQIAI